jgi:uncharacterized membrane protein (DUF4010 family)
MQQVQTPFPPFGIAVHIAVAVGCGLLVGLEREWAHKELGSRTFTIVSLLGVLSALISEGFVVAGFAGVIALIALTGVRNLVLGTPAEPTTAGALMVTFALGVLAGQGHVFTPPAAAILMTLLLSLKPQLSRFATGLNPHEVRGAVLLALIAFVIYPVLPGRFIDPWSLFNPREIWLTIVLIASIGFVNYVLLRLFSFRGLYYTAILGGLINSTAVIAELSTLLRTAEGDLEGLAVTVNLLTIVSMFLRNLVLLAIFSPSSGIFALAPLLVMAVVAGLIAARQQHPPAGAPSLRLQSPLNLLKVAGFGLLFLLIQTAGAFAQRLSGSSGIVIVSLAGGLASSASSTAAAATLAAHGRIPFREAALCTVLTSMASMMANLPVIYRQFRNAHLVRRLTLISTGISAAGIATSALTIRLATRLKLF